MFWYNKVHNRDVFGVLGMKEHKYTYKSILLTLLLALLTAVGCSSAFAETAPTEETYAIESFVEETTAPVQQESTEAETFTQDPVEDTAASEFGETESSSEALTEAETEPAPTYRESLPEVSSEDIVIPDVIGDVKEENEPSLFWGFVAWICIGVGVAVVLAVMLNTKTKAYRGGGKKRYSTGDKMSGKKRLLNDKYYHNDKRK